MNPDSPPHVLDEALRLQAQPDGLFTGHTHPAYANVVGPFGGATAAVLLQSILGHPQRLGDPVSFTVNFASAVADGPFNIDARAVRTNRSTQHWQLLQLQGDEVVSSASAVFAQRRPTWQATDLQPPEALPFDQLPRFDMPRPVAWPRNYDLRFVTPLPVDPDPAKRDARSVQWMRDDPPRPLDFAALAAMSDAFFPRIFLRRGLRVPAGTVSLTTQFHVDAATLSEHGTAPVLGLAKASHFGMGYHDQTAELWSPTGRLLATSHQMVYFKE